MLVMTERAEEVSRSLGVEELRRFHVMDSVMFSRGNGGPLDHFKQICSSERSLWLVKPLIAPKVPCFSAWLRLNASLFIQLGHSFDLV